MRQAVDSFAKCCKENTCRTNEMVVGFRRNEISPPSVSFQSTHEEAVSYYVSFLGVDIDDQSD